MEEAERGLTAGCALSSFLGSGRRSRGRRLAEEGDDGVADEFERSCSTCRRMKARTTSVMTPLTSETTMS